MINTSYYIGLDVGSTTVKAVVVDAQNDEIVWQDYQRHDTKQAEKVVDFLDRMQDDLQFESDSVRIFITGSGGNSISDYIGAKFVQEVNAVCLAVERLYPETGSVIELGGQDAKIIIFKEDPETGKKKKIPSMNDKCAGGTGAVIDKINAKLQIPPDQLRNQRYYDVKLHPVAGKCGVFAETDINGLQKQGVPADELMASLFESLVQQNLSVLTRGHTLRPHVLLLGGPNTFISGMVECWKYNIPRLWEEREYPLPEGVDPKELIKVPENGVYFAALGAVEFGKEDETGAGQYSGTSKLRHYIEFGRAAEKAKNGGGKLYGSEEELMRFQSDYKPFEFIPASLESGAVFKAYLGIDGGSTSTKGVLLDMDKNVAFKAYQLSRGNPIEDTMQIIEALHQQVLSQGCSLKIMGVGTTGYAKDILKDTLGGDVALVETVAHTQAALHFYDEVDVICDVGGQDIKIIILKDGRVTDFKLNTQCSAGNGYFLQGTAEGFGYPVEEFAERAFSAKGYPEFGYGCAVFMQSDIVDFQRQGWTAEEIMAGLAVVLPKNIWLYVSQIPNLAKLGHRFVLQGGTQRNMAAVKTQVDFIRSRFKGLDIEPEVIVHKHTGEAGAIGAAVESARLHKLGRETTFIGLPAVRSISYKTTRSEDTRCYFCKNKCLRTFIDVETAESSDSEINLHLVEEEKRQHHSKVPLKEGANRLIIATCEKGTVEDVSEMREIAKGLNDNKKKYPNLVEVAAKEVWRPQKPEKSPPPRKSKLNIFNNGLNGHARVLEKRAEMRIGIPRALNMYQHMPFFSSYFEALGVRPDRLIYSDFTTEEIYKEGSKRGSIDPCYPSKVSLAHIHNLLFEKHKKTPLDFIFFPIVDDMPTELYGVQGSKACPTVTGTVETAKAAFTKEGDLFKKYNTEYVDPFLSLNNRKLITAQLLQEFKERLELTELENDFAVEQGYKALEDFFTKMKAKSREVLDDLERENRIGIVMLARPYHADPGINHLILEEFQKLGYPVLSQDFLPTDADILERLFGEEVREGKIEHPMDISDVWKNSYSENTSRKVWAAKYVARHPNLIALELSSFKCGHDAPIYSIVQEIVECSETPYFSFKDIDENRPSGSIKIRTETIGYFLKRYRDDMVEKSHKKEQVRSRLQEYEMRLRKALQQQSAPRTYSIDANGTHAPTSVFQIQLPETASVEDE